MHLHEYQAKRLFQAFGLPVPDGEVIDASGAAAAVARSLGGSAWVVKAQVHAGGRGKAGGVKLVEDVQALGRVVDEMLGSRLVTKQTGEEGLPVNTVLVEQTVVIAREIYFGMLVDRSRERVALMVSAAGGMNIEEVAEQNPDAILTEFVNPAVGLQGYQCRNLGFALGLDGRQVNAFAKMVLAAYRLMQECDAGLLEINPLVVTADGGLLALDAKLDLDDNALFRHPELSELHPFARQYCLYGEWCRPCNGNHGPDQTARRGPG